MITIFSALLLWFSMKSATKKTTIQVWTYFGLENIKKDALKLKTSRRYCYTLHDEVGNTSNLLSHLKCTTQLYMDLSQNENVLRDLCKLICV